MLKKNHQLRKKKKKEDNTKKKNKTVAEIDREKLDKKFSKDEDTKLN